MGIFRKFIFSFIFLSFACFVTSASEGEAFEEMWVPELDLEAAFPLQSMRHDVILSSNFANERTVTASHLVSILLRNENDRVVGSCTGVIIANDMILTAAHCTGGKQSVVVRFGLGGKKGFQHQIVSRIFSAVYATPKKSSQQKPGQPPSPGTPNPGNPLPPSKPRPSPWKDGVLGYDKRSHQHFSQIVKLRKVFSNFYESNPGIKDNFQDLAVIKVDAIPAGYKPAKLFAGTVKFRSNVYSMGYGTNSRIQSEQDDTLRYVRQNVIGYYRMPDQFPRGWEIFASDYSGGGSCYGDSGGPTFIKVGNEYHLFGIQIFIYNSCANAAWLSSPQHYGKELIDTIKRLRQINMT